MFVHSKDQVSLFNKIFGDVADVTSAANISIDKDGHIYKVAKNVLKQEEPLRKENLEEQVREQERTIQILTGVNQLLKGQDLLMDKQSQKIAKKIHIKIKAELKNVNKENREAQKNELQRQLGKFTSALREQTIRSTAASLRVQHEKLPLSAPNAIASCQASLEEMNNNLKHMGVDIIRYLDSGHISIIDHEGDEVLKFEEMETPPEADIEAAKAFQLTQKVDRILHSLLYELDLATGNDDVSNQGIIEEWQRLVPHQTSEEISALNTSKLTTQLQLLFDQLCAGPLVNVDPSRARNLAHLLMGLNQCNFITPSTALFEATSTPQGSTIMACQAYNQIKFNIKNEDSVPAIEIQYSSKFIDLPEDRRKSGYYDCKFQIDAQLTQKSRLNHLDKWETDYQVTVLTPRNDITNLSEIGEIITKLKLNGFQVDIGTCDKTIDIG